MTEGDVGLVTETASREGVLDAAPLGPAPGSRVGRYRVDRPLGSGGMGVVVQAYDPELDRQVALKLVRADVGDQAYQQRLVREARAMAQLEHPNVVRVYDAGVTGGAVFVAMELVRGRSLGDWMREAPRPWREVVARFVAAGRGLAAAHGEGLVHRDFKPDNVLVGAIGGRVCVTDFGLAVPSGSADDEALGAPPTISGVEHTLPATPAARPGGRDTRASGSATAKLTRTGVAVGTPPYMAPEQHRGGDLDQRADVFSFCVSLYEGVYGERPFAIDPATRDPVAAWADAIGGGRVRPAPAGRRVPAALRRVLVRGLAVDPDERWPSMEPLLRALERVRGRRARIAIGAGVIAALGASAVAAMALTRGASAPAADPCADDAARIDSIWNADARVRVERAVGASGRAYAAFAAQRSTALLDRFAVSWRDERQAACHEADRGALPPDAWRARAACLDDALATMRARIDLLAGGSAAVDHASSYATLGDPVTCEDGDREPPPADPALRARIAAVQGQLRDVSAARLADDYRRGVPLARAALSEARAIGWRPLIDKASYEVADLDNAAEQAYPEAAQLAREVAESATARGDWDHAGRAWQLLLELIETSGHTEGLDYVVTAARGAAKHMRLPDDANLIEVAIGETYIVAGRLADAKSVCNAALAAAPRTAPGAFSEGKAVACLAEIAGIEARFDVVTTLIERRLAIAIQLHGPAHPIVLRVLGNLGMAYENEGKLAAALVIRLAVKDAVIESEGAESVPAARAWAYLAETQSGLHDVAHAKEAAARAVDIAQRVGAAGHVLIEAMQVQGDVLADAGDDAGAAAVLGSLLARLSHDEPGGHDELATAVDWAHALFAVNRCADALPVLDRITAEPPKVSPYDALMLETQRAECRMQVGHAAEAARDLDAAWAHDEPDQISAALRAPIESVLARALEATGQRDRALVIALRARDDVAHDESATGAKEIDATIARLRGHSR